MTSAGSAAPPDRRVAGYLGRILDHDGVPTGTCFQVAPGILVTAWHVLDVLGAAAADSPVLVEALSGGTAFGAQVSRLDSVHDLAILVTDTTLPAVAGPLADTDGVPLRTPVTVTGYAQVDDDHSYRFLAALGEWTGGTTRDDAVAVGRVIANGLLPGMSGAPVIRSLDGAVVGIVSGRYNSADGWLADNVWLARTEDLVPLLGGLAEVAVETMDYHKAVDLVCTVTPSHVRLTGPGVDVRAVHGGVPAGLAEAVAEMRRARARKAEPPGDMTVSGAGRLLGESFLPGPVAGELARVLNGAGHAHVPVRIGLIVPGELAGLPWEGLADPVQHVPLAMHPLIDVYRRVEAGPVREIPGPLRIVVAIAAPDIGADAPDYERELANVIAEVRSARQRAAEVRVVPFGSPGAIRVALEESPAHVLHVCAHGHRGALGLENQDGTARRVTPDEFVGQAIPPGKMPPVVALAVRYAEAAAAESAPSFAAALCERGAAAVITAETSVADRFATRVFARVYGKLAQAGVPDVIAAVAAARREVQRELAESGAERLDEWAFMTAHAASGAVRVFDPAVAAPVLRPRLSLQIAGMDQRDTGYFVGRRSEQRRWPRDLGAAGYAGLVIHGIGGVGKTSLAAEIVNGMLQRAGDGVLVSLTGPLTCDGLLEAIASALRRALVKRGLLNPEAERTIAEVARHNLGWRDRISLLREEWLDQVPLLVVLDNFEDNLRSRGQTCSPADELLGAMLGDWLAAPGRSRLVVTSRFRFTLPGRAERYLSFHQVGPLSLAETRKLAWSLPALDVLDQTAFERAWRLVGGHPRSLEYLDALLSHCLARYPDITARLASAMSARLGEQGMRDWLAVHPGLDMALAEAAAISANDALLDQLLERLRQVDGAEDLLRSASVYREAVDSAALLFQVGTADATVVGLTDREAARKWDLVRFALGDDSAEDLDEAADLDDGADIPNILDALTSGRFAQIGGGQLGRKRLDELRRRRIPPYRPLATLPDLIRTCQASGLLTVSEAGAHPRYFVHRWTATQLAERAARSGGSELADAHRKAAAYWRWRIQMWPSTRSVRLHDQLEALYHLLEAGEIDEADDLATVIGEQLHHRGAWDEELSLIQAASGRLRPDSPRQGTWAFRKGRLTRQRGDHREAVRHYQRALKVWDQAGDLLNAAAARRALGHVACDLRDYAEAAQQYQRALGMCELLDSQHSTIDSQVGLAASYRSLGELAYLRHDHTESERQYRRALPISKRLGDKASMASEYGQLGLLARVRGDYAEAKRLLQRALAISKQLDSQVLISACHQNLGALAEAQGDQAEAERRYRRALAISERLRDLEHIDTASFRLGILAYKQDNHAEAKRGFQRALTVSEQLDNQPHILVACIMLGATEAACGEVGAAVQWHVRALALAEHLHQQDARTSVLRHLASYQAGLGAAEFMELLTAATSDAQQARAIIALISTQ